MKYFSLSVLLGALTQQAYAACDSAYVYCPGIVGEGTADEHPVSTCFSEDALLGDLSSHGPNEPTNTVAWGWNIDLKEAELHIADNVTGAYPTKTCGVYAGAAQCDWENKGTLVGTFSMTKDSVTWNLFGYGATEFHLHIGQCPYSDGGDHLDDGTGNCVPDEYTGRVPGSYTLNAGGLTQGDVTTFSFNENNFHNCINNEWENITLANGTVVAYDPFNYIVTDLGEAQEGYHFVSAHAKVCPCNEIECSSTASPTVSASPTAHTAEPSPAPAVAPYAPNNEPTSEAPSEAPSGSPSNTLVPSYISSKYCMQVPRIQHLTPFFSQIALSERRERRSTVFRPSLLLTSIQTMVPTLLKKIEVALVPKTTGGPTDTAPDPTGAPSPFVS
jgi:hypothetical protein